MKALRLPLIFLFFFLAHISFAQQVYEWYQDGKIIFQTKLNANIMPSATEGNGVIPIKWVPFIDKLAEKYQITSLVQKHPDSDDEKLRRTYEIEFTAHKEIEYLISELGMNYFLEYVEKKELHRTIVTPNDLGNNTTTGQWGLWKIEAQAAWDISQGSSSIIVAVTDDGMNINHADLSSKMVQGRDVADGDNNPNATGAGDRGNHGTHVCGTVGSATNNNTGVASIGWNVSIMPVKCARDSDNLNVISAGYEGINWAAQNGAHVINASWGSANSSTYGQNIVNNAYNAGVVIIAAAGNDNSQTQFYPAAYSNVISVANTRINDAKSNSSNYGTWIDISAPGENIRSTLKNGGYGNMTGTSMASPLVAGLAGLMLSVDPSLSPADVKSCLQSSADNIDAANGSYVGRLGAGRINALKALQCVANNMSTPPNAQFSANPTTSCSGLISFTDESTLNPTSWSWNFGDGNTSTQQNPQHTYASSGNYTVTLTATNTHGSDTETKTSYITINKPTAPSVTSGNRCGPGTVNLSASSGSPSDTIKWYSASTGGTPLGPGNNFTTPSISTTTTYYAETTVPGAVEKVGPVDNTIGAGGYFNNNDGRGLLFDVHGPCQLKTVKVYANTAGDRTIELLQSVNGAVLASRTVNIPAGESRITLDFSLTPGTQYHLKVTGSLVDLYRNSGGANFPYEIAGLVSITETDAVAEGFPSYYYYFYDWELQHPSCVSARSSVTATINPLPNLTATTNSTTICAGASSTLTASGANSYSWDNGLGSGASKTVSPTSTTTYTVTGTANGCSNTASVTVNVNPLPSVTAASGTNPICAGASTTLTASGAASYSWNNGLGSGANKTISPTSNTTYTVTGTANGCSNTASVTVNVTPLPNVTATANSTTICAGASSTLTASGANSYSWNNGLGAGATKTVSPTNTTTYTVTGTSSGCSKTASVTVNVTPLPNVTATAGSNAICIGSSTTLAASGANSYSWNSGLGSGANKTVSPTSTTTYTVTGTSSGCSKTANVTVTVNPLPQVGITAGSTDLCVGGQTTLTANGASTYSWSPPNGLSATTGTTVTASPSSTTTYTVVGTDANGCQNSQSVTLTVGNNVPTVSVSADKTEICEGESVLLNAFGADTYAWNQGLGSGASKTASPMTTTTYTVTGTNDCGTGSSSVTIVVNPLPATPIITQTGNTLSVNLTAGQTVLWYFNGNPVSGGNTATITMIGDGDYRAVVADENGCESYSEGNYTTPPTNLFTNYLGNMTYKIYPVPNAGLFTLEMGNVTVPVNIRLIDVLGKEIATHRSSEVFNDLTLRFDLTERATGIYFLILEGGQHRITEKVVVTR